MSFSLLHPAQTLNHCLASARGPSEVTERSRMEPLDRMLEAWAQSPSTHPLLGDWRRAGYRRGAAEPRASGPAVPARTRGIEPNRPEDVSARIQDRSEEHRLNSSH